MKKTTFALLIILNACSLNPSKDTERSIASISYERIKHRPFLSIMFDGQVQDSRLNKEQTEKLIERTKSRVCARSYLNQVATYFYSKEINTKIQELYQKNEIEIHLGGVYRERHGKINFDPVVQAHIPGTDYHKTDQYLYQVRLGNTSFSDVNETIIDRREYDIKEFLLPACEVDKLEMKIYLHMLNIIAESIENAKKEIKIQQLNDSSVGRLLEKYY